MCEDAFDAMLRVYDRGLRWVLAHQPLALAATIALAILTGWLYVTIPKGLFPEQDTGFIFGQAEAREDISFALMVERQNELAAIVLDGSGGVSRLGLWRHQRVQSVRERRPHIYSAEAVLGTRRLGPAGHPASAAQGGKGPGRQALPPGGAGSHFRRPADPHPVPVHADLDRPGPARSLGADPREAPARHSRRSRTSPPTSRSPPAISPSRSTATRPRGSAFRCRRSTRPSTTLSASARWRRSTARPPSTRSCSRRRRISTRIRRRCRASMSRAPTACRCRSAPSPASSTRSRRSPSTIRACSRR